MRRYYPNKGTKRGPQPVDWREMFKKYCSIVRREEGVDFLYERNWTLREWQALGQAGVLTMAEEIVEAVWPSEQMKKGKQ